MIGTGIEKRIQVQQVIESQLPEYILSESPKTVDFLRQYYISQEHRGGVVDISDNLDQYLKLDNLTPEVIVGVTTLSTGITTISETIEVSSTKGFPDQYGLLKIDDEIKSERWKLENGREARWMTEDDMKNVGVTSGVKKILAAVKNDK